MGGLPRRKTFAKVVKKKRSLKNISSIPSWVQPKEGNNKEGKNKEGNNKDKE